MTSLRFTYITFKQSQILFLFSAAPIIHNMYAVKTFTCVKGDLGLRIQCKATGHPKPSVVWKKDGLDIVSGNKNIHNMDYLHVKSTHNFIL